VQRRAVDLISRFLAHVTIRPGVLTPRQKFLALRNVCILVVGAALIVYPIATQNDRLVAAGMAVSCGGVILSGAYFILRATNVLAALFFIAAGTLGLLFLYLPVPYAEREICALGAFACLFFASRAYVMDDTTSIR
jgi:uncharacterized membrane protein HdeD (DUF308 family)